MKIIQVTAVSGTMHGLLGELNKQTVGNGYELICICSDGEKVNSLRKDGYNVVTINIDRKIAPFSNLKSIVQMVKVFKNEQPDIVHVHTPIAALLGRIAAKIARVPNIIYTAHGFYFHENMSKLQYKKYYLIEKYAAKYLTDYIFTQSEEDGQLAIDNHFLPKKNITIIGNGVDVEGKFNPSNIEKKKVESFQSEFEISKGDLVITFIGRLVKEKGILELLDAFEQIKYSGVKLIIVGETSVSERDQETKSILKKYETNDNIIFTGYRSDIPEILDQTDIFCLPSYREGMPRSIIEAMSMECAIVATDIRGSREEVDHGINGYLTELYNVKELQNAIEILIKDRKLLEDFKKEARSKARNLYNEQSVVQKQLSIFKTLLQKKNN